METKMLNRLVSGIAKGALAGDAGTLALVAFAIRDGVLTFDQDAAGGKGRWKGTTTVVKNVLAATTEVDLPRVEMIFTKSKVNKAATVIRANGAAEMTTLYSCDDSEVLDECKRLLGTRTLSGMYADLVATDAPEDKEDKFTLSGALATVVAAARKREIPDSTIMETLAAILAGE